MYICESMFCVFWSIFLCVVTLLVWLCNCQIWILIPSGPETKLQKVYFQVLPNNMVYIFKIYISYSSLSHIPSMAGHCTQYIFWSSRKYILHHAQYGIIITETNLKYIYCIIRDMKSCIITEIYNLYFENILHYTWYGIVYYHRGESELYILIPLLCYTKRSGISKIYVAPYWIWWCIFSQKMN
jgi:hypothetical protein